VLPIELAIELKDAGLRWKPARGDRFVVRQAEMAGEVFVLSDMTVEVHDLPQGNVIGFNGTTEWALDSIDQAKTVWLPRETQLRELLGGTFHRLDRSASGDWSVRLEINTQPVEFTESDPEVAYGRALLHLIKLGSE
jgi:hypothetical protein